MKKRIIPGLWGLATAVWFSGCGMVSVPKLSSEQEALITEYAADAVMRHVNVYHTRLADLSLYEEKEEKPAESEEDTKGKMDEVADTPIVEVSEPSSYELGEVLLPEHCTLSYQGFEVLDSYPNAGEDEYVFAIDAAEEKKLVILHFDITNNGSEDAYTNIAAEKPYCVLKVNDNDKYFLLPTFLGNDLTTYQGSIGAGATYSMVMVAEIPKEQAEDIQTLRLSVSANDKTTVLDLQ